MNFASDNTSGAHPAVMAALAKANEGRLPSYGEDALTARAADLVRETFEAPEAAVRLVATGTAANSLALATLCAPFDVIFCTAQAHIQTDECNAPEFFTGGAKLLAVADRDARMSAEALRRTVAAEELRGVHGPRRGPVSITSVTERGTVYSLAETVAIAQVCRDYRLRLHLDGARLANAAVALSASAAELSWHVGVDAVSFGGTKNGCLGVEAVVFFDPADALEFERRRKRAGHLFSKHRYLAAQMVAYLEDGLWLRLAGHANAMGQRLRKGLAALAEAELPDPGAAGRGAADWGAADWGPEGAGRAEAGPAAAAGPESRSAAAQPAPAPSSETRSFETGAAAAPAGVPAPRVRLVEGARANLIFADLPRGLHRAIRAQGADYHMWDVPEDTLGDGPEDELLTGRFVCAWDTSEEEVDRLLELLRQG